MRKENRNVRSRIGVLIVLGIALAILAGPKGAFAFTKDSGTGDSFLELLVDPTYGGTPIDGMITLYYEPTPEQGTWNKNKKVFTPYCPDGDFQTRMSWFMRFNYNGANYAFSGNAQPFCYVRDMQPQADAISNFILTTVFPSLIGAPPLGLPPSGSHWEFKFQDIRNFVQPQPPLNSKPCCRDNLGGGYNGGMEFLIGDVTIGYKLISP